MSAFPEAVGRGIARFAVVVGVSFFPDFSQKKMETVEKELRARLENHDLPVKVGDRVYCIRNWGKGRYIIEEHTVIEIVFEYDNQMRIKTSCGLFGYEKWTLGLDCFADPAEAETRLKKLQGGER